MLETFTPAGDKDNIIPEFFIKPVKNEYLSEREGREVWEDKAYVRMIVPGDKNSIPEERVKDSHRDRWPNQWAAFEKSREAPVEGTPLDEWAGVTRSQVMEMGSFHVRTVEQLAGLSDAQLAKVVPMGGHALRQKAQRFLDQAKDERPLAEALQRIRELEEQLKADKIARETPIPTSQDAA